MIINLKANKIYFKVDLPHGIKIMNSRTSRGFTLKKNTLFQGGIFCACRLRCILHMFSTILSAECTADRNTRGFPFSNKNECVEWKCESHSNKENIFQMRCKSQNYIQNGFAIPVHFKFYQLFLHSLKRIVRGIAVLQGISLGTVSCWWSMLRTVSSMNCLEALHEKPWWKPLCHEYKE